MGSLFARSIKISVGAMRATKLFTARRANKTQFNGAGRLRIYIGFIRIGDLPLC
jgi:hypothetical protein